MSPDYRELRIEDLQFDPENPRLPLSLDTSDLVAVLTFMLEDEGLLDLMRSIAKQGFFPGEPLLVSPIASSTHYVVVEGNRRFASSLLLNNPDLAPIKRTQVAEAASRAAAHDLTSLPCLVFPDRESILDHLGYRHVTGIKEWEPLAKARFLRQRFEQETGTNIERFKSIARSIGSRADYVGRLLCAFRLYETMEANRFYQLPGVTEESIDFSLISSLLAYADVVEYLGLDSSQDVSAPNLRNDRLAFLTRFVFPRTESRTGLGESRNIRTLADVLGVDRAREALEGGASLSAASKLAGIGADAFRGLVGGARENLDLALGELEEAPISRDDVDAVHEVVLAAQELETRASESFAAGSSVRTS